MPRGLCGLWSVAERVVGHFLAGRVKRKRGYFFARITNDMVGMSVVFLCFF